MGTYLDHNCSEGDDANYIQTEYGGPSGNACDLSLAGKATAIPVQALRVPGG
jgi:hypothetical protein